MFRVLMATVCICSLLVGGCIRAGDSNDQKIKGLQEQVTALSQDVRSMQDELQALRTAHARDLKSLRTDMKHLLTYLNASLQHLEGSGESATKRAVQENVNRLLDLSKQLLDKLEQELNQSLEDNK